ncbi:hypothetical protein RI367_006640 [Sorochytrium milnesiophthora]
MAGYGDMPLTARLTTDYRSSREVWYNGIQATFLFFNGDENNLTNSEDQYTTWREMADELEGESLVIAYHGQGKREK